eukprot:5346021-Pyramimonas_sp.AAC.1
MRRSKQGLAFADRRICHLFLGERSAEGSGSKTGASPLTEAGGRTAENRGNAYSGNPCQEAS